MTFFCGLPDTTEREKEKEKRGVRGEGDVACAVAGGSVEGW
jgi:hypothetical protein